MNVDVFYVATSQNLATSAVSAATPVLTQGSVVRLYNNSTFPVYVRLGPPGTVAVDLQDVGIPPGGLELLGIPPFGKGMANSQTGQYVLAAISVGGAGNLNVQTGEGAT